MPANKCIICFFLFQFILIQINAQPNKLRFKHYTTTDGLSQGVVFHIMQDSRGFMWFSTFDGLNRFDGYNFKVFKPSYNDSNSIKGGYINYIIEEKNGMIWVGTNEALNCYNLKTNYFKHFYIEDSLHHKLKANYQPIFIDDKNELWFSYNDNLGSMNLGTGKFTTYSYANGAMQQFITIDYPSKKVIIPTSF